MHLYAPLWVPMQPKFNFMHNQLVGSGCVRYTYFLECTVYCTLSEKLTFQQFAKKLFKCRLVIAKSEK